MPDTFSVTNHISELKITENTTGYIDIIFQSQLFNRFLRKGIPHPHTGFVTAQTIISPYTIALVTEDGSKQFQVYAG